ncbi:MAG: saccharopine dehydrogenase NADP-binding domain-containing protein [Cryomorphaceae bacterium]|nr:saccharopine dehydrogenase NADP-binding domain-containing protein [Cryomorphaceae bacterium]
MKKIAVLGAGRSAGPLIEYLATHPDSSSWTVSVYDQDAETLARKTASFRNVSVESGDLRSTELLDRIVSAHDVVVSMLPAFMHLPVAERCVRFGRHLVTASYISPEMQALDAEVRAKGLVFVNECGVDPGIDHMSTMELLHRLRREGAQVTSYESFCGGILAPESPANPWSYKFTWNPRNVVLAGAGGAVHFVQEGQFKHIPYHEVFRRTEFLDIPGYGRFEAYANRDSLKYQSAYGLEGIGTMYRGTLRRPGFCRAWDVLVKLGATDDSYPLEHVDAMTHRDFLNTFLAYRPTDSVELKLMHYLNISQDSDVMERLEWLGLFADEPVGLSEGTPAQVLQQILMKKWTMTDADVDMLAMIHRIEYTQNGQRHRLQSSLVAKGVSADVTAMSYTVGWPVAMATRLVALDLIPERGVLMPNIPSLYEPILAELGGRGIRFDERDQRL